MHSMQKYRENILQGGKYKATLSTITAETKRWKPSCNKPEATSVTSGTLTRLAANERPGQLKFAEGIETFNSQYKRFNPCAHVKYLAHGDIHKASFSKIVETIEEEDESDYPHFGCADSDYIYRKLTQTQRLELEFYDYLGTAVGSLAWDDLFASTYAESQISALARTAIDAMTPKLDTGFSTPQFLAELLELKSIGSSLLSVLGLVGDLLRRTIWRHTFRDAASSNLAYQFGLVPLVADIRELVLKFHTVGDAVFRFIENEGKLITSHYERRLTVADLHPQPDLVTNPTAFNIPFPKTSSGHDWYFARDVIPNGFSILGEKSTDVTNLEYHATMRFRYRLPELGAAMKSFMASLDHFGFNASISDFWEVVPFSFLVDWVVDIGGWLEEFDFENLPVTLDIVDFCDSVKYVRTDTFSINGCVPSEWTPLTSSLSWQKDCYHRWTGLPPGALDGPRFQAMRSSRATWRLSILVSLVAARQIRTLGWVDKPFFTYDGD